MYLRAGIPRYTGVWVIREFCAGLPWYTCTTLEGWSVEIPPVRSTAVVLAQIPTEDHAFNPAATAGGCAVGRPPFAGFIAGGSAASLLGPLRMRSVGVIRLAWELFRNS